MQGTPAGMLALRGGGLVPIPAEDAAARREAAAREVMREFYRYSIPAFWLAWLLYWYAAAIGAKRDRRREPFTSRLSHILPLGLGIALLAAPHAPVGWLGQRFLPRNILWFWVGLALVALGLAFAVAARIYLAGNWSSVVTLKEDHELIRSGPYRWTRHPIYSGLLLALLGSAIAQGEWRGFLALALAAGALLRKSAIEERFMTEAFGTAYTLYRQDVPRLVPLPRRLVR